MFQWFQWCTMAISNTFCWVSIQSLREKTTQWKHLRLYMPVAYILRLTDAHHVLAGVAKEVFEGRSTLGVDGSWSSQYGRVWLKRESPRLENLTLDKIHVIAVLACYILLQQTCMISIHGAAFYLCAWPARLESPSLQCLEVVGSPEVEFPAGVAVQQRSTEASILALPWCKQWTQPGAFDCLADFQYVARIVHVIYPQTQIRCRLCKYNLYNI